MRRRKDGSAKVAMLATTMVILLITAGVFSVYSLTNNPASGSVSASALSAQAETDQVTLLTKLGDEGTGTVVAKVAAAEDIVTEDKADDGSSGQNTALNNGNQPASSAEETGPVANMDTAAEQMEPMTVSFLEADWTQPAAQDAAPADVAVYEENADEDSYAEPVLAGTPMSDNAEAALAGEEYEEPAYEESYEEPVYEEPVYEETYEEPAYEEPVYEETYEEPVYEEPVYEEPYEEPAYEEPVLAVVYEDGDELTEEAEEADYEEVSETALMGRAHFGEEYYEEPAYEESYEEPAYEEPYEEEYYEEPYEEEYYEEPYEEEYYEEPAYEEESYDESAAEGEWVFDYDTEEWYYVENSWQESDDSAAYEEEYAAEDAGDGEFYEEPYEEEYYEEPAYEEESYDDSAEEGEWVFDYDTEEWYYVEYSDGEVWQEDESIEIPQMLEDGDTFPEDNAGGDYEEDDDASEGESLNGEWIFDEDTQEWYFYAYGDEEIAGTEESGYEEESVSYSLGQQIVDYAMQFVGVTPYVWGGGSLYSGTDCSGFVHLIFDHFGIYCSTASLSYDGSSFGHVIGFDELQPGDIIVYGGGDHVAIYAGGGYVVHCSSPENGTVYWDMHYRSDMSWCLRVLD